MPRYVIESSATVYYRTVIEADTMEEAKSLYYDGDCQFDVTDETNFQLDDIYEEGTNH